jgi:hypothetical protein
MLRRSLVNCVVVTYFVGYRYVETGIRELCGGNVFCRVPVC